MTTTECRKLDAWIHEHIMGECVHEYLAPSYSTDIAAAWLVIEKLCEKVQIELTWSLYRMRWSMYINYGSGSFREFAETSSLSPALVICRLAKRAYEEGWLKGSES